MLFRSALLFALFFVVGCSDFPDENFKEYLLVKYDKNFDDQLSIDEKADVAYIRVSGKNIHSLKGIEQFKNLKGLVCSDNQLTSLDISNNTKIEYLDIRMNGLLETLYVWRGFKWDKWFMEKDDNTKIVEK